MGYCTGSGNEQNDHCCYVDGVRCPHSLTSAEALAWINAQKANQGWTNAVKNAAREQVAQFDWNCKIAMKVAALNPNARTNRGQFNQLWDNDPEYLVTPAPSWRALEQAQGLPANSYQCSTWQGGGVQCCFRRTTAECDAIVAAKGASTAAVTVRRAGGRAD